MTLRRWIMLAFTACVISGCSGHQTAAPNIRTPQLRGMWHDAAIARIIAAGLCPGRTRFAATDGQSGVVIGQSPVAGVPTPASARVALTIGANGPYAEIVGGTKRPSRCRG